MRALILAALCVASSVPAQVINPGAGVSTAQVQNAIDAATPDTCGTPLPDNFIGSPGVGNRCMPRIDMVRPSRDRTTFVTTGADGTFSGTWPVAFATDPSYADAKINSSDKPFVCQISTQTAVGFTGRCFAIASTTLPGTILALGGLVVSPITNPTAGLTVRVFGRQ